MHVIEICNNALLNKYDFLVESINALNLAKAFLNSREHAIKFVVKTKKKIN